MNKQSTPPRGEHVLNALHACFGVMMQPYLLQPEEGDGKLKFGVSTNAEEWIRYRREAEKQYYEAIKPTPPTVSEPQPVDGWISVDDRLPEIGEFVLVYNTEGAILTGKLLYDGWVANFLDGQKLMGELTATHWQAPNPPQSELNTLKQQP